MASTRVGIIGSGNAFNEDGRGSQCLWLEPPSGSPLLVDVGPTALAGMARAGRDCKLLDRLFLTHLHGDHIAGWPFLLLHLVVHGKRRRPFDVFGPPGTRETLEGLSELCYRDVLQMQEFDVRWHEIEVAARSGIEVGGGLMLDVVPMEHHASSIGLRLRAGEHGVGVSGDTAWCANLERLAEDCDLLFLECTTVHPTAPGHVCLEELRADRQRLPARSVVLVHLPDAVSEQLARDPVPGVIAAHDGMVIELGSEPKV